MLTTEGLILRTVKYGETSVIVDIYSKEKGLIHGIAGGVRKKKSNMPASLFQLLQPVQVVLYYKDNEQLSRIKEIRPTHVFHNLHLDPVKRTLIIFYAELLQKTLKEIETNTALFDAIVGQLVDLEDRSQDLGMVPIEVLLELSSFLGFYPNNDFNPGQSYFHMGDGNFQPTFDPRSSLYPEDSALIHKVLSREEQGGTGLNKEERNATFKLLLKYYQWHIPNFGKLKSPEILQTILS